MQDATDREKYEEPTEINAEMDKSASFEDEEEYKLDPDNFDRWTDTRGEDNRHYNAGNSTNALEAFMFVHPPQLYAVTWLP